MNLAGIDWAVILVYLAFVLGVGVVLRRRVRTSADFFLAGRAMPAWICGLAFISANIGAQEVIGMGASGAKYGIATSHFYWVGAIPAMVFVGIFMMPFYYGSRARSVPEYLRLRFDEKTRGLTAISFAVMTIFSSGVSLYAMARLIETLHVLDGPLQQLSLPPGSVFHVSVLASAAIVLFYTFLGGLTGAIYNEVLQFFLIVAGFLPLTYLGLESVGGWQGLSEKLPAGMTHSWAGLGSPATNPLGVEWFGLVAGLGFVLSFGYWCTDFLVVQRALAANSMSAARRTPLIAALPKMFFPAIVILPGVIAAAVPARLAARESGAVITQTAGAAGGAPATAAPPGRGLVPPKMDLATGLPQIDEAGRLVLDYDLAVPNMLLRFFPAGILGLGLAALLASFMSGMAGNVTAFNTVWTYDIYQSYIRPLASDAHFLWMGRVATVFGIGLSVLAAYVANSFNNIMDLLQLVFAFVNAPLFATFLLGMFWKRTTGHGAFAGLVCGTLAAAVHHGLTLPVGARPGIPGGWLGSAVHRYASQMSQNFWTAIWAFTACFAVTIAVSLVTRPRPDEELRGLVYSLTERPTDGDLPFYKRPVTLGIFALGVTAVLNVIFW